MCHENDKNNSCVKRKIKLFIRLLKIVPWKMRKVAKPGKGKGRGA